MADALQPRQVARFDGFNLDLRTGELRAAHNGTSPTRLPEQPFRILAMLLDRPGDVVSRQEIRSALWPNGTVVEFEHSISAAINRLRQALGDSADSPRYIETLARRGYRWKPSVEWVDQPSVNGSNAVAAAIATETVAALASPAAVASTYQKSPQRLSKPVYAIAAIVVTAGLLIAVAIFWWTSLQTAQRTAPLLPAMKQLTNSSFENHVLSGAISPDGKLLAFSDSNGVRIQLVATGETREVLQPEEIKSRNLEWEIVGTWLPDSSGFFANAHRVKSPIALMRESLNSNGSSVWSFSALGAAPRKIRDNALAYSVSPDGSLIAFGANAGKLGDREVWLMSVRGEETRRLVAVDDDHSVSDVRWSKDGKHILYKTSSASGSALLVSALQGSSPAEILGEDNTKGLIDFFWRPDGELLYSKEDSNSFAGSSCNLWVLPLDARTVKPLGNPRRLTNWSNFCLRGFSQTADGKRIAFLKSVCTLASFVADLAADNTRAEKIRHFPLNDSSEAITDWLDSRTFIFVSNRSGEFKVYKQSFDQNSAELLVPSGYGRNPNVVPGGRQLVYLGVGEAGRFPAQGPEPVNLISLEGGLARQLFIARRYSLITCARVASGICIIGEPSDDDKQLIVTAIHPVKGRGLELFRFPIVPRDDSWYLDISPQSDRVAVTSSMAGPIHILSLRGEPIAQVDVKSSKKIVALNWDAEGKGFFITSAATASNAVLHVSLRGEENLIWENAGAVGETLAIPSPDGRRLALNGWTSSDNIWTLENLSY